MKKETLSLQDLIDENLPIVSKDAQTGKYTLPQYENMMEKLAEENLVQNLGRALSATWPDYQSTYLRSEPAVPGDSEFAKILNKDVDIGKKWDEASRLKHEVLKGDLRHLLDRLYEKIENESDPVLKSVKQIPDLTKAEKEELILRRLSEGAKFWGLPSTPKMKEYEFVPAMDIDKLPKEKKKIAGLEAYVRGDIPDTVFVSDKVLANPQKSQHTPFHEVTHFVKDAKNTIQEIPEHHINPKIA